MSAPDKAKKEFLLTVLVLLCAYSVLFGFVAWRTHYLSRRVAELTAEAEACKAKASSFDDAISALKEGASCCALP